MLLLGWAGAFCRTEIAALDLADVRDTHEGLRITLRRSKTDQEGEGPKRLAYRTARCPPRVPCGHSEPASSFVGSSRARLFQSRTGRRLLGRDIARILQSRAAAAGLDAHELAAHALRAELVAQAAKAGKTERILMQHTGHQSIAMVRKYIRDASLFVYNAAEGIGL